MQDSGEHDPETSDADEGGISDADLAKMMRGLEHGSSRRSTRSGAARRGDLDEVILLCTVSVYGSSSVRRPFLCIQLLTQLFASVPPEHR